MSDIPKAHEINFKGLDNIVEAASSISLNPSDHKDQPIDSEPMKMLVQEANFWGERGIAMQAITKDPWDPNMRKGVASRMQTFYDADPKVYFGMQPDILRADILEKGKPLEKRAKKNMVSYVEDHMESLLKNGKMKNVKKIATLLDKEYRMMLKLLQDQEFDDMRAVLRRTYSGYHVAALDDQKTAAYFSYLLDVKKEVFLMRFNEQAGDKVYLNEKKLIEFVKDQYNKLDDDCEHPAMKYSIAEKVIEAFSKRQRDKADDLAPHKDDEDDWFLPNI